MVGDCPAPFRLLPSPPSSTQSLTTPIPLLCPHPPHAPPSKVLRLMLPRQKFSFSRNDLNLLDDPGLAAAFSTSLRASFLEVPHAVADPIREPWVGHCQGGRV